ncbi:MAG: hypothetical protein QOJ79_1039 [Actinomycetota bacterium]|jgi:hypothetical protein|nr:hypothetical protein [Actinomycetota bacterium]
MLPPSDSSYLDNRGFRWAASQEQGVVCLVIFDFQLPPGFSASVADLLIHLPAGYPDTPLDMWWFSPRLTRADGSVIPATESSGTYLGREWQRWSRHFASGQWRPGVDSIETYLARIRADLCSSVRVAS